MPTLPLPADAPIGGGDLVLVDEDDVEALLPHLVNESDSAPIRDALKAAIVEMLLEYQRESTTLAENHDSTSAEGLSLDGLGSDIAILRQANDEDSDYRIRQLVSQLVVTPTVILSAVNAILTEHSTKTAKYAEQLDGWFVGDGTTTWASFVFDGQGNASPFYPDRLYKDEYDGGVNTVYCEGREPGGAIVMADKAGRWFQIRVPDLSYVDETPAASYQYPDDASHYINDRGLSGFFVGDGGVGDENVTFVGSSSDTEFNIYQAIVDVVERIKGHGVRWSFLADPNL